MAELQQAGKSLQEREFRRIRRKALGESTGEFPDSQVMQRYLQSWISPLEGSLLFGAGCGKPCICRSTTIRGQNQSFASMKTLKRHHP